MRREFSKAVKVARLRHATRNGIIRCEGCGVMVKPGQFAFDHDDPDGMTGEPTFDNCRLLCVSGEDSCHGRKTKLDQSDIARAKRLEAAHVGAKPAPSAPIRSAGFHPTQRTLDRSKRAPKQALPPKQLYR
jgi:hypothetical protein